MNGFFDIPSDLQSSYLGLISTHMQEALVPVLIGLLLALPIGLLCVRVNWVYPPVLWITTVLYAIPSIAFFVVLIDYTGLSKTTVMIPLTTSSVMPFPAADRISARFQPKVQAPEAGRAASRMAHSATAIAPTSDSMCPASDSSASDPDSTPAMTSATMNAASRSSATTR